jgi:hypothetical protein
MNMLLLISCYNIPKDSIVGIIENKRKSIKRLNIEKDTYPILEK